MQSSQDASIDELNFPSEQEMRSWFELYGSIYTLDLNGNKYFYRRLTRREFKLLSMIEDDTIRSESLCEIVMLWPHDFKITDDVAPSFPDIVTNSVMKESGFTQEAEQKLNDLRERLEHDIETQMETLVEYVFGSNGGKFDKYQDWSMDELLEAYERAIWIETFIEAKPHLKRVDSNAEKPKGKTLSASELIDKMKSDGLYDKEPPSSNDIDEVALAKKRFEGRQRQKAIMSARNKSPGPPAMRGKAQPPEVRRKPEE